jgi:methanogenic corrinoid protein MtbC1
MENILDKLSLAVERGKVDKNAPFPPEMIDMDGADELTREALNMGIRADEILNLALFKGMRSIGEKFRDNKVFVPEVLMAAKAMTAAMYHLRPYFKQGIIKKKGTFIIGTAAGDMHDIGKTLVAMIVEGGGWDIIDLGTNAGADKFIKAIEANPGCSVGISALLTTTMVNMEKTVRAIREKYPDTKVLIGGAPVNQPFCDRIGADFYSPEPHGALDYLNSINQ